MDIPQLKPITQDTKFNPEELKVANKIGLKSPLELENFMGQYFSTSILEKLDSKGIVEHSKSSFERLVTQGANLEEEFSKLMSMYHLYKIVKIGIYEDTITVAGECVVPDNAPGLAIPFEETVIMAKLEGDKVIEDKNAINLASEKIRGFHDLIEGRAKELFESNDDYSELSELPEFPEEFSEELSDEDFLQTMDRQFLKKKMKDLPEGTIYIPKKVRDAKVKIKIALRKDR